MAEKPFRILTIADAFASDLENLTSALTALGFSPKIHNESQAKSVFKTLGFARSYADENPGPGAVCYLEKADPKFNANRFAFLIIDSKAGVDLSQLSIPALVVERAAAAVDVMARRQWPQDWYGQTDSGHSAPSRFPHAHIEADVLIGPDVEIGDGSIVETGCRLGAGVRIGKNCRIGAFSSIGDFCELGSECELSSHVAIGGQGFGFVHYPRDERPRPRRHLGRVILKDRVRLGSHVSVDRGVFDDTCIGEGSALDNIVQVAHNSKLGSSNIICSFVGLSGTTVLGDRVTIAGMVGTKGHITVGDDVTIAAQSGISKDVASNQTVKGYPPRPLNEALELQALYLKLPEFFARLKKLETEK